MFVDFLAMQLYNYAYSIILLLLLLKKVGGWVGGWVAEAPPSSHQFTSLT